MNLNRTISFCIQIEKGNDQKLTQSDPEIPQTISQVKEVTTANKLDPSQQFEYLQVGKGSCIINTEHICSWSYLKVCMYVCITSHQQLRSYGDVDLGL